MLSDPQFWILVAFIIFILAVFKPIKKILISNLDIKIAEIKKSIDEAENLKNETQQTLSEIKKRQNNVKKEIANITNNAEKKIITIEQNAQTKLNDQINKRKDIAKIKIDQLTREANIEIHNYVAQTAIKAAIEIIRKKLNENEKQNLIDNSIGELDSVLKN